MRVAGRVRVREIDDDEGRRLLRIIRRGTGSAVPWRRAPMVLLSAQGMLVAKIAEVTFTSPDRVRDVIHAFTTDGVEALYPKYKGGLPRTFTLPERREIKKIATSKPAERGLPFSTWSLAKPADFLVPHPARHGRPCAELAVAPVDRSCPRTAARPWYPAFLPGQPSLPRGVPVQHLNRTPHRRFGMRSHGQEGLQERRPRTSPTIVSHTGSGSS
ncbi:helix-turn-helix domain-containing protein [Streptosporangium canum]|uniref:helix-turn-helix domain-containing protein n=1 Tax=Streptosporangium canum TaxID=324952 RepID=UPI0033A7DF9C